MRTAYTTKAFPFYPIKFIGQKEMELQTADQNKIQDRYSRN